MKTIKTISKLTMLFAFVAFANTLKASGNLKVNIYPLSSEKAVVAISNNTASNFQISIQDEQGETIYYKETDADNKDYRKVFDFSKLEAGSYTLKASIDGSTTERSFTIGKNTIAVDKEKVAMQPYFSYKEGVLGVSYLNFGKENLNLHFYDANGLVYSKEIGKEFNVIEGFDLSKLASGEYTVVLLAGDKEYAYNVSVE
ncbi:MAG: T9SS type A sorting domain-containing protein [Candidatus Saccharibacteria bacterium]